MKNKTNDFDSFAEGDSQLPAGSAFILNKIHQDIQKLAPHKSQVAVKMGLIHLFSSILTLSACPQFGLRLFFKGEGLMHYFMQLTPTFCQSLCGGLYLSVTFLLARLVLSYDEWLMILRSRTLSIGTLTLGSLGTFAMINQGLSLEAGAFWILGAVVGAEVASISKVRIQKLFAWGRA